MDGAKYRAICENDPAKIQDTAKAMNGWFESGVYNLELWSCKWLFGPSTMAVLFFQGMIALNFHKLKTLKVPVTLLLDILFTFFKSFFHKYQHSMEGMYPFPFGKCFVFLYLNT
ncbi:hypothetical protein XENORESO_020992 [Xenotaenia resolanae]|uniref:Uncharacterized protein n=1 Tax=Xenotaenia resolanae TaxID=208358 RepID=A0ABV0WLM3_9TELE